MAFLDAADLAAFAEIEETKAQGMIDDASALAVLAAPCLGNEDALTEQQITAVKAVLRGAVLRWNDSGSGAFTQQGAGPFNVSVDTRQARRSMFWPSEITQLQAICRDGASSGAFAIDTAAAPALIHADTCSINFGATYCSCGAILTGYAPLYGA
jgi:hypothetical protein